MMPHVGDIIDLGNVSAENAPDTSRSSFRNGANAASGFDHLDVDWRRFAADVRAWRGRTKTTLRTLGSVSGVHYSLISRLENDRYDKISGKMFLSLVESIDGQPGQYLVSGRDGKRSVLDDRRSVELSAMNGEAKLPMIVLIDDRCLMRGCLAGVLAAEFNGHVVAPFKCVEEWRTAGPAWRPVLILWRHAGQAFDLEASVGRLRAVSDAPLALLADDEDGSLASLALSLNLRGIVSGDVNVEVFLAGVGLMLAGGTFIPPSALPKLGNGNGSTASGYRSASDNLSKRELQVLAALRDGKSSAAIATDLGIRCSTVDAHIHNVMKKYGVARRQQLRHGRLMFPSQM